MRFRILTQACTQYINCGIVEIGNAVIFLNLVGRRFMESKFVTMWDLNIGVDINIYGKVFKLVDCDHFTRHFLSCQGVSVPSQIPIPPR